MKAEFYHGDLTACLKSLVVFLLRQQVRPRKERHTAKHRAENTIWVTQVRIRGTHRIRAVLWGEMERKR